jgi:hypothetical protein
MTTLPPGQVNTTTEDDPFDIDKYRQAAEVAYSFSKKKLEDAGTQERETIGKGASEQRTSAEQGQQFKDTEEAQRLQPGATRLSILSCLTNGSTT